MMKPQIYSRLIELAKTSTYRQRMSCIITDKRGLELSFGINKSTKTHPLQARYAEEAGDPTKIYLHAEIDALIKLRSAKAHTLYVCRINSLDDLCMSKPCPVCKLAIEESNIKVLYYSTSEDYRSLSI